MSAEFTLAGNPIEPDKPVANIFAFCTLMAAVVANKRGGKIARAVLEETQ